MTAVRSGGSEGADEWAQVDSTLTRVPTQSRSRSKVDRSLAAAAELLESEGVDAVTLTRVAKEAGVSVGALYQYLPDREAIVNALSAQYHARHETVMDTLVTQLAAPSDADPVESVVGAFARLYREQSGTRALRAGLQSTAQTGATRAHKERMVAKVHTLLGSLGLAGTAVSGSAGGSGSSGGSDRVARTVFFAADSLMHEAFSADDDGDPVLLDELSLLLRSYLMAQLDT